MPKVSLIMPIYNAERYIKLILDSLLKQTYEQLEYILVDDGSTDHTLKIIKQYEQNGSHIKVISLAINSGVSKARNQGIEAATGTYLFFLDSDDFLDPNAMAEMVLTAMTTQADLVEIKKIYWFQHKKQVLKFAAPELQENFYLNQMQIGGKKVYTSPYTTGKLYHRDLIGTTRFDEGIRCYEDVLFTNEIIKNVKNYVFLPNVSYHYMQRQDSLVNSLGLEHLNYLSIIKKIKGDQISFDKRDELIINSILAIITGKISKVKMPLKEKRELIRQSMLTISELYPLSKKQMRFYQRFLIRLFKNKKFLFVYLIIIKKINLITITYFIKAKLTRQRIKKHYQYEKAKRFYELLKK